MVQIRRTEDGLFSFMPPTVFPMLSSFAFVFLFLDGDWLLEVGGRLLFDDCVVGMMRYVLFSVLLHRKDSSASSSSNNKDTVSNQYTVRRRGERG